MYKPHYLNVERTTKKIYGGNVCYFSKTTTTQLGWKRKPPEKLENKSGRRFSNGKLLTSIERGRLCQNQMEV